MRKALAETARRRSLQSEFNRLHGITPQSIRKRIDEVRTSVFERDYLDYTARPEDRDALLSPQKRWKKIEELGKQMAAAAKALEFEKAARLRDEIAKLKTYDLEIERP
jgi:excinuclease ABC subunit B